MKSRILAVLVALILALVLVVPVLAHAILVRSIPDANASLKTAPAQVELFFSEQLDSTFSNITVLNSEGIQVDNADTRVDAADPTHLLVSIPSLADGVYTVSWKALSAADGHLTTGAYPFAIGNVDPNALAAAGQKGNTVTVSVGEVAGKWLLYLSTAMLVGGTLFVLLVWQPAYAAVKQGGQVSFSAPWRNLSAIGLIILLVGSVLALLTQAGLASGGQISAPWSNATSSVIFNTRFGALWLARLVLAFGLAALLPHAHSARDRWIAFGLGVVMVITISLGSHAAADAQPWLPLTADSIHILAASVWVGGLTHFVAGLWAARTLDSKFRTQLTARLIPRFSAVALISVGILSLTGLYTAIIRIGSWDYLSNTLYGRILIIKLILALPMVAFGAINLFGVTPAMKKASDKGDDGLVARFRNIVSSEVMLGVVLLLSVGLLTSLPPAQAASGSTGYDNSQTVDDLTLDLNILPGRVGLNTFTLTLTSGGQPVFSTKEVLLKFTPNSGKLPPSQVTLSAQGNGQYVLKGSNLSLPDDWQVQAVVRRDNKFDAYANYDVNVGAANTGQTYPWNRVAGGLLLAGALAYLYAFSSLGQTQRQLIGYGIIPAVAIALVSVAVFFQPPVAEKGSELVNPIPPNADSVAKGQALFAVNCVPCHGQKGLGDGPVGLTLSPRPANLQLHAVPGVHTDGQLYLWVSDGYPGSVMPAFRGSLSDDDRWNLVNFIRTLAPK